MTEEDVRIEGTTKGLKGFFFVGPLIAVFRIADALIDTVLTDLIVYRTCVVSLDINTTECYGLRANAGSPEAIILEAKVEPHTSMIVMSKSLIENILPIVTILFLGSWSDRFGRRPLFLATFYGLTTSSVIYVLMSLWDISPWYLLIALIPFEMVGASHTEKLAADCYISDTTTMRYRLLNFALMKGTGQISRILGRMIGAFIYKESGYTSVFGSTAVFGISGILYTHFVVPESVKIHHENSKHEIFKISNVKDLFVSCVAKRQGFNRPVAWLGIICLTLSSVIGKGQHSIEFLFTRARLGWDVEQYSYYSSVHAGAQFMGLCGVLLRSYLSDTFLAGLSLLSKVGGAATKSLTWQTWHMYLALGLKTFSGLMRPVMRTLLSKVVPAEDIGKIFTVVSLLQLVSSFGSVPLLTFFYFNYLPPIYPSPVFLLPTSLYILVTLFFVCMEILIRKSDRPASYSAAAQDDLYCSGDESEVKEVKQNTQNQKDAQIHQDSSGVSP